MGVYELLDVAGLLAGHQFNSGTPLLSGPVCDECVASCHNARTPMQLQEVLAAWSVNGTCSVGSECCYLLSRPCGLALHVFKAMPSAVAPLGSLYVVLCLSCLVPTWPCEPAQSRPVLWVDLQSSCIHTQPTYRALLCSLTTWPSPLLRLQMPI